MSIVRKILYEKNRSRDSQLRYALWVDIVSTKRSTRTSHLLLLYGVNVIITIHLGILVMNMLEDKQEEHNDMK